MKGPGAQIRGVGITAQQPVSQAPGSPLWTGQLCTGLPGPQGPAGSSAELAAGSRSSPTALQLSIAPGGGHAAAGGAHGDNPGALPEGELAGQIAGELGSRACFRATGHGSMRDVPMKVGILNP